MSDKILFIVNPVAGRGRSLKLLPKLKEYLRKNSFSINTEIYITEKKGDAKEFVSKLSDEFGTIVAVGGDGTINEIINGINFYNDINIGVLPCGSGNDFAKAIGINNSFNENIKIFLKDTHTSKIDIGRIIFYKNNDIIPQTNYFINSCGIGFDALVAHLIRNNKFLVGLPLYLSAVFKALFRYQPLKVNAIFDSLKIEGDKLLISIGNGKASGGGFVLNPFAEIDDGKLDVCLINNFSKLKIIKNLTKAISGKHFLIKGVELHKFKNGNIKLELPNYLHLDGEVITTDLKSAEIDLIDHKVKIIKNKT